MYDFYLGDVEEIKKNETRYLVAVKRMLPRWINSIPDSELLALAALLDEQGSKASAEGRRFVTVETGVGASTLAFVYYAMKYDGLALTWDTNAEKGSKIRTVCNETLSPTLAKLTSAHWKLIACSSTSAQIGLLALPELAESVDFFFHDSEHVWDTVRAELEAVMPVLSDGAVVALDDANQTFLHTNTGYVNTVRRKLGLPALDDSPDNIVEPFFIQAERLLREHWQTVAHLPDVYKQTLHSDAYFSYYDAELDVNKELATVRTESFEHRFDSWRVADRIG